MNPLKNVLDRVASAHRRAKKQRDSLLLQKRERFLSIHDSETPPSARVVLPPRRAYQDLAILYIWASLMLLYGFYGFGKIVVSAFYSAGKREHETKQWIQKLTVNPPLNERGARNQQWAEEIGRLETQSARDMRRIMALAALLIALPMIVFPALLIWLLPQAYLALRSGIFGRAKVVSRNRWSSTARLRFATIDGKQIEVSRSIPSFVTTGAKLWVLYSPRYPKRAVVYRPDLKFVRLVSV